MAICSNGPGWLHRGYEIRVDRTGVFESAIEGEPIRATSLGSVKDAIDSRLKSIERHERKKISVRVALTDQRFRVLIGTYRGINRRDGSILMTVDGEKIQIDKYDQLHAIHPDHPEINTLIALKGEIADARRALSLKEREFRTLVERIGAAFKRDRFSHNTESILHAEDSHMRQIGRLSPGQSK